MGSSEHGFFQIDRSKGESVKETKTFPVSFFFTLTIFFISKAKYFSGPFNTLLSDIFLPCLSPYHSKCLSLPYPMALNWR